MDELSACVSFSTSTLPDCFDCFLTLGWLGLAACTCFAFIKKIGQIMPARHNFPNRFNVSLRERAVYPIAFLRSHTRQSDEQRYARPQSR